MTDGLDVPRAAETAPATAKLVWCVLETADGELRRRDLLARTGVSRRALDSALATLQDRDLVLARIHPGDRRCRLYRARGTERDGGPRNGRARARAA